jgi:hypothetical protein
MARKRASASSSFIVKTDARESVFADRERRKCCAIWLPRFDEDIIYDIGDLATLKYQI